MYRIFLVKEFWIRPGYTILFLENYFYSCFIYASLLVFEIITWSHPRLIDNLKVSVIIVLNTLNKT